MLSDIFSKARLGIGSSLPGARVRAVVPPRMNLLYFASAILLVFALLGPLMTLNEGGLTGEGSSIRQFGYLTAFILAVIGTRPFQNRTSLLVIPFPIVIALAWCWISLSWALEPDISLRRLFLTTLVTWTVFIIVLSAGYRPMLAVVRIALVVALIGNYLTVYIDPLVGIHQASSGQTALAGNWCGFMAHKNFAGAACALCIICFLFDAEKLAWWLRIAVIAAAGWFLYKAQSKTSLGVGGIALLGGFVFQRYNAKYRIVLIPLITIVGMTLWWVSSTFNDVLRANYLDPAAFTGRGQIWQMLLKYSGDHLMQGTGYGSFWNIGPSSPVYSYGTGFLRIVTVGHNGYLDLLVTIGLPGVILVVLAVLVWPIAKLLISKQMVAGRGALIIAMILFCMGHNVTESSMLDRDALVGVFLMLANAFVARETKVKRRTSSFSGDQLLKQLGQRRFEFKGSTAASA